jgi:hypothetical protein
MTKPLYFYNGTTFEQIGPTTPQSPIAYQTSAPTGPATGDLWIDSDGDVDTYNRQLTRYYFVATAAQTTITGTDANGLTLAYVAGSEAVYVNGALQVRGQDYTATDGTSVVMSTALAVNDVVEIFAYTAFTVANAYTKSETDSVAAAAAGLRMIVPSSVAVGSGSGSANSAGYVSFSGASTVSLNDVFSSTYDNYKIIVNISNSTGSSSLSMRMRVSGADNTNNEYTRTKFYVDQTNAYGSDSGSAGTSSFLIGDTQGTDGNQSVIEMQAPFLTQLTKHTTIGTKKLNLFIMTGSTTVTTSYTGFTLLQGGTNMTGTVAVYGYKD